MVKKVLDIIPPEKPEADPIKRSEEKTKEEIEIKPKITYIPRKETPRSEFRRKEIKREKSHDGKKFSPVLSFAIKLVFVLAMFFFAAFLLDSRLAKAKITIWPKTETLNADSRLTIDSSAIASDFSKKIITGKIITAEKTYSDEFPSTGKKNSQNKAEGTIKIYNNFTSPQRLIKGTRLQAPLEKFQPPLEKDETPWFRTTQDVTVPMKSSIQVKVLADGIGEKYNIDPSIFSIPGLVGTPQYTFIYGQSFEKFKNGEKKNVAEIKQEDLDNAKDVLTKRAQEEIKKELAVMSPEGFELIPETIKINTVETTSSVSAGTTEDKFSYQVKTKATAVIFNMTDLDNFGKELIIKSVPVDYHTYDKSLKTSYFFVEPASEEKTEGKADLQAKAEVKTYLPINETDLKKGLAGKRLNEAKYFLMNQAEVKNVELKISPFWRINIPNNLEEIEIELNFE